MAIWVDRMRPCKRKQNWPWDESCHLFSDRNVIELHNFAFLLGLKRHWFQAKVGFPHYDLTRRKREWAIRLGAGEHF